MKSYIIELGQFSGEGKYTQWDSRGFLVGIDGLSRDIVKDDRNEAFRFESRDAAETMQANCHGLKNARVMEVNGAPSTRSFRVGK